MIDWLTGKIRVQLPAPIADGWTLKIRADGTEAYRCPHRLSVFGSFEASVTIRAVSVEELEISGNIAKFVQGHNLYGSDDPVSVLWAALQRLEPYLGGSLAAIGLTSPCELAQRTTVSRIDCTKMLQFDSAGDALSFLRSAAATGRIPRRGRGVWKEGTLVFGHSQGKSATRWQIVLYSKGQEVTDHPLPAPMMVGEVLDWANVSVRVEVRMFRHELKEKGLRVLAAWGEETSDRLWREKVAELSFNEAVVDEAADLAKLPDHLRGTYAQWKLGQDLRQVMKKAKFYRHRRLIEVLTGVDISIPPAAPATATVVPIKRLLEGRIGGRPHWADRIDAQLLSAGAVVFPRAA